MQLHSSMAVNRIFIKGKSEFFLPQYLAVKDNL